MNIHTTLSSSTYLTGISLIIPLYCPLLCLPIFGWNIPLIFPIFLRSLVFPFCCLLLVLCTVHWRRPSCLSVLFSGTLRLVGCKIGNIKGTFHPKVGTIKYRNSKDLGDAEDIKKRWKEYTKELNKKGLNEPDYSDDVVSHPEPHILEFEVKWALGLTAVNKASGCDGIPVLTHFSCVTLWDSITVACQAPLYMGFSRQEYWCGLPYPSPGDLPDPGIEPTCLTSPALAGGFFTTSTTWNYSRTIQTKPQRMMPSRCCSQHVSKSGRLSSGHRTGKGQSSSQFPRRAVLKNELTVG